MAESTRTKYRKMRIDMILYIIGILCKWLILDKRHLEKINLPLLKVIKNNVEFLEKRMNRYKRISLIG